MLRMYLIKKRSPRKAQKARKKPGTGTMSKAHRQDWKDACRKPGNILLSIFSCLSCFSWTVCNIKK